MGTVAFYDGTSLFAIVPVAKGKARTVVTLAKGSNLLRAVYSGSGPVLAAWPPGRLVAWSPVVTVTAT